MPLDWQTVVVTAIAFAAALVILRRFVPAERRKAGTPGPPAAAAACNHCETGARATASPVNEIGRTPTTPVVSVDDLRATAKRR